ncbi:MAG: hypothetical protein AVDCRST_MAG28-1481, partial [uncultured Rubrobacteraceae bacterium]
CFFSCWRLKASESSATSRASSSVSWSFRSTSISRTRVFNIWLTTAPTFGSIVSASTSSARVSSWAFRSFISRPGLERAALEAFLRRASLRAGSCAGHQSLPRAATPLQRSPFAV